MLISTEADTKTASAVPDIVARVIVYPIRHGERDPVEEHITREVAVSLA